MGFRQGRRSTEAVGLHQHYSNNDFNKYGFLMKETVPKIPTHLQTKLFIKSGCQRKPGKMLKMSTEGGPQNKLILTS